jgi:hypothetical protein
LRNTLERNVCDEDAAQFGVRCEQEFYADEVIPVDGLPEFACLFERLDVLFEFGPTRKAIVAGELQLGGGQRGRRTSTYEVLRPVVEIAEIGTIGKLHGEIFSNARYPHVRAKGVSRQNDFGRLGFYPFRRPDASLTLVNHSRNVVTQGDIAGQAAFVARLLLLTIG